MKQIILLGASGSIGQQTLDVIRSYPKQFELVAISVGKRVQEIPALIKEFNLKHVCVRDESDALELSAAFCDVHIYCGDEGLIQLARLEIGDTLVNALVGFAGLIPTLTAIEHKKNIALANKETLIVGGKFVKEAVKKYGVELTPIDSEHSAIFQCLQGNEARSVDKVIITASGGSFRDLAREDLAHVDLKQALAHPNWSMGAKITIDSATLMNKGFEVIEAHYLFDLDYDQIDVLIHRESIIHSMVQYCDSAVLAQLGTADMRLPIQFALTYPLRYPLMKSETLDLAKIGTLHFEHVDEKRYPFIKLAYEMGKKEGNACAIMNAANEEAVSAFLSNKIQFLEIEELVFKAIDKIPYLPNPTLADIIKTDTLAREFVAQCVRGDF